MGYLYSVPLVYMPVFMLVPHYLITVVLKLENTSFQTLFFFFFSRLFCLSQVLWVCMWILQSYFPFSAKKKNIGNLIGIVLSLYIALGSIDMLTTLSSNPWSWNFFPFIFVFLHVFQQCFVVFFFFS